jgi:aminoglycoside phosphotransferase (APT) family kinase protein
VQRGVRSLAAVIRRLIATEFPHWSDLDVVPVDVEGWDNSTFRLGDDPSVTAA